MEEKILLSITGNKDEHYLDKMREIKERNINRVALFLECFSLDQRKNIYSELKKSKIKEIPLVHIRDDMDRNELEVLFDNYKSTYFTIHENHFDVLSKWSGFERNLFLEMSTDNIVAENVDVDKIGGFCVDLAHYQKQKDKKTVDYDYVYNRRNEKNLFRCNHLSGYSLEEMTDLHWVNNESDFDYLKKMPRFVFGDCMAIEINNSIEDQLKFRKHISKLIWT
jgi:hypothetical protein